MKLVLRVPTVTPGPKGGPVEGDASYKDSRQEGIGRFIRRQTDRQTLPGLEANRSNQVCHHVFVTFIQLRCNRLSNFDSFFFFYLFLNT